MTSFDVRLLRAINAGLDEEVGRQVAGLIEGKATDFADYRARCGKIRGLELARTVAEEARQALLRDDEGEPECR